MTTGEKIRVRMAPSPTGYFHIGSARTALYNWLFARHNQGSFIIRVEDTDATRSSAEMIQVILDSLAWLGLDWDEGPDKDGGYGPYYQSQRKDLYHQYVEPLIKDGRAYWCFCTPEQLRQEREASEKRGVVWQYDRRCRGLSQEEIGKRLNSGQPRALRFFVDHERSVAFDDLLHGHIEKRGQDLEDFVILKSDGMPTYNFACVVDDHLMKITHVIRGVEHIANTPKQVLLYESLGWPLPHFVHLPVILGTDKKKLSKRLGARSVLEYRDAGYLPETVLNALALLGWSPGRDREIMDRDEMVARFGLDRINPANAVFDEQRMDWLNNHYIINRITTERYLDQVIPFLRGAGLLNDERYAGDASYRTWISEVCALMRPRLKVLRDIARARYFFVDDFEIQAGLFEKVFKPGVADAVRDYRNRIAAGWPVGAEATEQLKYLESELDAVARQRGLARARIIHPLRAALTGTDEGPGVFEVMRLLGKETCLVRLERAVAREEKANDR